MLLEEPPEVENPIDCLVWLRLMLEDEESLSYLAHSAELRAIYRHYVGEIIMMVYDLQQKVKS